MSGVNARGGEDAVFYEPHLAPSPLAVPDDVRRLVWEVAGLLADEVVGVEWAHDAFHCETRRHRFSVYPRTAMWSAVHISHAVTGGLLYDDLDATPEQAEKLSALAIEVEEWASGLVAQAVTDGDWGRP